jgi:hypothetical protein
MVALGAMKQVVDVGGMKVSGWWLRWAVAIKKMKTVIFDRPPNTQSSNIQGVETA